MDDLIPLLEAEQTRAGAFRSWVHLPGATLSDDNAFVTTLVLHELRCLAGPEAWRDVRARAAAFLIRCESPSRPGCFAFWPGDAYPSWMKGARLYEDADDTALVSLELEAQGVRDAGSLRLAADRLLAHRADASFALDEPWQRRGAFLVWLYRGPRNTIDCCVNANAVTLLARAGLAGSEAYLEACAMIGDAVEGAGDSPDALARLTPYYPQPFELLHALDRAVVAGARELAISADRLRRIDGWVEARRDLSDDLRVCSSVDGRIVWTSPMLQLLRRMRLGRATGGPTRSSPRKDETPCSI